MVSIRYISPLHIILSRKCTDRLWWHNTCCESTQREISRLYLFGGKIGRIFLVFEYSSSGFLKNQNICFNICFNYGFVFSDFRKLLFCKISEESLPFVSNEGERKLLKPSKSYTYHFGRKLSNIDTNDWSSSTLICFVMQM